MHIRDLKPKPNAPRQRTGFTLVELLVVVGVLIVLTTLTLGLVNVTQDEDRVRSAAAQVQSYLEGARDRAIHAGEPRGVRFLIDTTDPSVATSLIYIGSPETFGEGDSAQVAPYQFNNLNEPIAWAVRPSQTAVWRNFHDRGLISNGTPIQIENQFYTIHRVISGNADFFRLTKRFSGTKTSGLKYRLFLNPTVLPNQEPRELPPSVVIDLDESIRPTSWGGPGSYGTVDVLFSPNGTVTGLVASAGVIHLTVADQVDVDLGRGIADPTKEGNERIVTVRTQTGNISVHNIDPTDSNSDNVADDPRRYAAIGETAK